MSIVKWCLRALFAGNSNIRQFAAQAILLEGAIDIFAIGLLLLVKALLIRPQARSYISYVIKHEGEGVEFEDTLLVFFFECFLRRKCLFIH